MRRAWAESRAAVLIAVALALALASCGPAHTANGAGAHAGAGAGTGLPAALVAQMRPIGHSPRFHPGVSGPVPGPCRSSLGRRVGAHVELFAANRVVLIARGIGLRAPRVYDGRVTAARCYGALVTLDPTGVVYVRSGTPMTLGDLFTAWGQPLSRRRLASFTGRRVAIFVNGRARGGDPRTVPLSPHAEIVLEVGPFVPPHPSYTFPPGS